MTPEEKLLQGDIQGALKLLQDEIRKQPAEVKHRVFLFQLLSVLGQWDRALTQLNLAADMDAGAIAMKVMYSQALSCEALREEVFRGTREPVVFGKPGEWVALLLQALKLTAEGEYTKSQEVRAKAFEMAPATSGEIDGQAFEWIADADCRLGPVLEVILEGRYLWVPFQHIQSIDIEAPEDLRDMIWLPAHFSWTNGGESYGLIPTRYPDSQNQEDPLLALSRKTDWETREADVYIGYGQRLLTTDAGDFPIMDIRKVNLTTADVPDQEPEDEHGEG